MAEDTDFHPWSVVCGQFKGGSTWKIKVCVLKRDEEVESVPNVVKFGKKFFFMNHLIVRTSH